MNDLKLLKKKKASLSNLQPTGSSPVLASGQHLHPARCRMLPRTEATLAVPVLSWPCCLMSSEDKLCDVSFMNGT